MTNKRDPEARRQEILDVAASLFSTRGYSDTSISEILRRVGIARGTLYHHFPSKEAIMDGLIERHTASILAATREIASNRQLSIPERLAGAIQAQLLWVEDAPASQLILDHLHQERNAMMHHKINSIVLRELPAVLAIVIQDGMEEGVFSTKYPRLCAEMAVAYVQAVFNDDMLRLRPEEREERVVAYVYMLERLLGAQEGAMSFFVQVMRDFHA